MKRFEIEITGTTPLMQHKMTQEALYALGGKKSKKHAPEETRTPRQIASDHVYQNENGECYIPMEYVVQAFIGSASEFKQTNSKRASLRSIAAGVFRPEHETALLLNPEDNKVIKHWEVDVRKATNFRTGAVMSCRPRFEKWRAVFRIGIDDTLLSTQTAQDVLEDAGKRMGIGSYRVAKKGYFGQFNVTRFEELKG